MKTNALQRSFFERKTELVAKELLGKVIVKGSGKSVISMYITETEAYLAQEDLASHARFGPTTRNEVMFRGAGFWYVYFIYGIHEMLNVTAKPKTAEAGAILIRAGIFAETGVKAKGPGLVTRELGIGRELYGLPVHEKSPLLIRDAGVYVPKSKIIAGPRVGVDYAKEWKNKPWRFQVDPDFLFKMD